MVSPIKSPAVPLCYTYVHQDGVWWGDAWPCWDGHFWWAIADMAANGPKPTRAAIAVRMSDESLVIVRAKAKKP